MSQRVAHAVAFSAFGLIFFVCTLIVARWAVDFVTWSTIDAGWAQALGSLLAIAVAFQIGARQSKDAIKAIVYGYDLATRRRYDAYGNIAIAAREHLDKTFSTFPEGAFGSIHLPLALLDEKRRRISAALERIDVHDVGTFEAQDALHELRITMTHLDKAVEMANSHLASYGPSTPVRIPFDTSVIRLNCLNGMVQADFLLQELQRPIAQTAAS